MHAVACREAYRYGEATPQSVVAETRCALSLIRFGAQSCRSHALTPAHGSFGVLAGRGCHWRGADERVKTAKRALSIMTAAEPGKVAER